MSEPAMLSVENLSAWYGAARILYDLDFTVGRGEVVLPLRQVVPLPHHLGALASMPVYAESPAAMAVKVSAGTGGPAGASRRPSCLPG